MSNEEIIQAINAGGDRPNLMLMLWQQNKGLIAQAVNRYRGLAEYDDMQQEAYLCLDNAVSTYSSKAGAAFSTYFVMVLRQWLRRAYINKGQAVKLPEWLHKRLSDYRAYKQSFLQEVGREPDAYELSELMRLTVGQVEDIERAAAYGDVSSLESPITTEDSESLTIGGTITNDANEIASAEERMYNEQLKAELWGLVDELPQDEASALRLHYAEGLSYLEIGPTAAAAKKCADKGLKSLRAPRSKRKLKPYYDEIRSHALRGTGFRHFSETWESSTEREAIKLYNQGLYSSIDEAVESLL